MSPPLYRPLRSVLAVPAIRPDFFEKAARGPSDALFLDLEDAVFADQKLRARAAAVEAIERVDWGDKRLFVRVNALETEWEFRDILALAESCPRLDGIIAPKVSSVDELRYLERTLDLLDRERRPDRPLELHVLIETAQAVARIEAILESATRLVSATFGGGDYAISMGVASRVPDGTWHAVQARIANACHACGVQPVDSPLGNIGDLDLLRASARRAQLLGFVGKWAIHPTQVEIINETFSPSPTEIEWAHRVAAALKETQAAGKGSARLDGRLIEAATMKIVENILSRAAGAPKRGNDD